MTRLSKATRLASQSRCSSRLNAWVSTRDPAKIDSIHQETAASPNQTSVKSDSRRFIAIKDNICTTEEPTTCASGMLRGFRSPFAATVVEKLEAAGILIAGKTNLDEFGMGSDSIHSIHGPVQNWYLRDGETLSAGGSSGGSAVVVATKQCSEALGTDTGGSVRLPASYTGIVGFKPSYGMISRRGVVSYANSLDTVGILGQSVAGVFDIYTIIKGYDARDPTSVRKLTSRRKIEGEFRQHRNSESSASTDPPLRIGVPTEYNTKELEPNVRQAWMDTLQTLQGQGHSIHPISLPATKMALSAYYIIAPAEASSNLAKYDGMRYGSPSDENPPRQEGGVLYSRIRGAGLGEEVKRRILLGSFSLSAGAIDNYFIKAQKIRRLVQQDFNRAFKLPHALLDNDNGQHLDDSDKVDVIIAPTALGVAPKMKDIANRDPVEAYSADVLTVPASLAGLPAISVPVATPDSVKDLGPIGLQVIGQYGDDERVIAAARIIESLRDGHDEDAENGFPEKLR